MVIALWILNILLGLAFVGAGTLKLVRSRSTLIDGGMPWAADFPAAAIKTIALAEVVGGLGLVLPVVTGIAPVLAPVAAVALAIVMTGAIVVHVRRREPIVPALVLTLASVASAVLGFLALGA